jgi:hypothetical protein
VIFKPALPWVEVLGEVICSWFGLVGVGSAEPLGSFLPSCHTHTPSRLEHTIASKTVLPPRVVHTWQGMGIVLHAAPFRSFAGFLPMILRGSVRCSGSARGSAEGEGRRFPGVPGSV